jgi:hypothetical protein
MLLKAVQDRVRKCFKISKTAPYKPLSDKRLELIFNIHENWKDLTNLKYTFDWYRHAPPQGGKFFPSAMPRPAPEFL